MKVLIVGAGFAGAVYARTLADAGHDVEVVDRRPHVAGNAFDYEDERGVRVHKYGPHLFHTSNEEVVRWVRRFGRWEDYFHKVQAQLPDGRLVPMPVNRATIEAIFDVALGTEAECRAFLASRAAPVVKVENAADYLYSTLGTDLTNLFFRPYNKKMWELDLEEIDASVVARVPLRYDLQTLYFASDKYQILPVDGYTALFGAILDSRNVRVSLNVDFDAHMEAGFDHVFNSMPIDQYHDYVFGELPYRSIRFHHRAERDAPRDVASVVNFTDDGTFTRMTRWHLLPHHGGAGRDTTVTLEEPCDYKTNDYERYYPVKTSDNRFQALYGRYKDLAQQRRGMTFIGRCGTYQYLDMHQVINQSLAGAKRWLAQNGT